MRNGARLRAKVVPDADRDAIAGWLGECLKLRVRAPADKGRANAAACALLATSLDVPVAAVAVEHGHTHADKLIRIAGLDVSELSRRIHACLGE